MNVPTTSLPGLLSPQEVSVHTDTRELLAHAKRDARKRGFQDWLICDIDAHHVETVSWKEIVDYIEDPVIRQQAIHFHNERVKTRRRSGSTAISACATRAWAGGFPTRTARARW
jgi:hypothetical protein